MGSNVSSFSSVKSYNDLEYKVFFSVTCGIFFLLAFIAICILCYKCKKKGGSACDLPWKLVHGVLYLAFPQLISINLRENTKEEVHLFGGKEFKLPKRGKRCISCCTYAYFIIATLLAITWFVLVSVESGIYRKTTTCNDINVQDKSFSCFAVSNKTGTGKRNIIGSMPIDCTIGKNPNISVFCYLYNPNPAAIGIAYSIVKLITGAITVYFNIAIYCGSKNCAGKCGVVFLQILLGVGVAIFAIVYPTYNFNNDKELYFFHGDEPLRWIMFILAIITGIALIPVPWCCFTSKKKYREVVQEEEEEETDFETL